jgi:hypothetical protein
MVVLHTPRSLAVLAFLVGVNSLLSVSSISHSLTQPPRLEAFAEFNQQLMGPESDAADPPALRAT